MLTSTCDVPTKRILVMVPTFTPENQTSLPFFKPATSSNTALIFMFLAKLFCSPPSVNTPIINMTRPSDKNIPTIIALLFSVAAMKCYLNLLYKVEVVKWFYPFVIRVEYLIEGTYPPVLPVEQHRNTITGLFGTGNFIRDDNRRGKVLLLYLVDQFIDVGTGYRVKAGRRLIIQHNFRV